MKKTTSLVLAASLWPVAALSAADWPQWRGPDRNEISKETGLLKSWPKDGPKLLWTFREAGAGYSGPAIVGEVLYTMGADDKNSYLYALDVNTQKKLWNTEIGPRFTNGNWGDGPRGTPTVSGDMVFAIDGTGYLIAANAKTGEKVWLKKLKEELGGANMAGWGYTESPVVEGDQVVCCPGGDQGCIAAFNRKNGDLLWRTKDFKDKCSYSSLLPAEIGGVHQYVYLSAEHVVGVDAKEGKILWKADRKGATAVIPTPIVSGELVFVTSGYGSGCNLLKVTRDDKNEFKVEELKKNANMANHHGGVVLLGQNLYGYDDSKGLVCLDLQSTEPVKDWGEKGKHGKMSVTCADGQLYWYGEKDGAVQLTAADPKAYKENGSFAIPEQAKGRPSGAAIRTHPVVANGKLFLRDQDLIFCYDVKASNSSTGN
jgi:outer membrane protein assembly factor BamB